MGLTSSCMSKGLRLKSGKMTALVGRSGDGKTTLLKTLAGLHPISAGEATYRLDHEYRLPGDTTDLRRFVHYVGQGQALLPFRTVRSNLLALPSARRHSELNSIASIEKVAEDFGISHLLGEFPGKISNGQYQRTLLARSIVLSPAVLFIDEITSSLDPPTTAAIIKSLTHILGGHLRHIVFATHYVSLIPHFADRVVFIRDGGSLDVFSVPDFFSSTDPEVERFRG